jgi:hypothetical protein
MTPLPNTRVQRTRSSASPLRSPLTRRPLGASSEHSAAPRAAEGVTLWHFGGTSGARRGCAPEKLGAPPPLQWRSRGFAARLLAVQGKECGSRNV